MKLTVNKVIILICVGVFCVVVFQSFKSDIRRMLTKDIDAAEVMKGVGPAIVMIHSGNATGSGFIVHPSGYIVTNSHVMVENSALIKLSNGSTVKADLINFNEDKDIALLKTQSGANYEYISLGDSAKCKQGDPVLVAGSPLHLESTVTKGIISAIRPGKSFVMIQTDAAMNMGNSGGPLLNALGEVIGINSLAVKKSIGEGLGFAVSINDAKPIIEGKEQVTPQALVARQERKREMLVSKAQAQRSVQDEAISREIERKWDEEDREKRIAQQKENYTRRVAYCERVIIEHIGFDPRTYNASHEAAKDRSEFARQLYRDWGNNLTREQVQRAEYYVNNFYSQRMRAHAERKGNGISMFNYKMKQCVSAGR